MSNRGSQGHWTPVWARGPSPRVVALGQWPIVGSTGPGRRAEPFAGQLGSNSAAGAMMSTWLLQASRFALRRRLRDRWFSAVLILVVGLAAGTSTAVYTTLDTAVLQAMPFRDPGRLFVLRCNSDVAKGGCPIALADAMRTSGAVDDVAYYGFGPINLERGTRPPLIVGTKKVSSSFFSTLGLRPSAGRWFLAADNTSGASLVVLSDQTRTSLFDSNEDAVGSGILMDGRPYQVVGVMPPAFAFPDSNTGAWVLDPSTVAQIEGGASTSSTFFVRAKPTTSREALEVQVNGLVRQLAAPRDGARGIVVNVSTLESAVLGFDSKILWFLFIGTVCLVVIACANVAGLLVSRSRAIVYNHIVQVSLGASPWRPRCESVIEYLWLSIPTAGFGLAVAAVVLNRFQSLGALNVSRAELANIGIRAVVYCSSLVVGTFCLSSCAAIVAAGSPTSLNLRRLDALHSVRFAGLRFSFVQRASVAVQLSLAVLLAVIGASATLLLVKVWTIPLGFEPRGLFAVPIRDYPTDSIDSAAGFTTNLAAEVQAVAGVQSVGVASAAPLTGGISTPELLFETEAGTWSSVHNVSKSTISANYLDVLGARMVVGRQFGDRDVRTSPCVAIVNRVVARQMGGVAKAANRTISTTLLGGDRATRCSVIGVVEDVRQVGMMVDVRAEVFYLERQRLDFRRTLLVRLAPDSKEPPQRLRALLADRLGGSSKVAFLDVQEYVTKGTQRDRLIAYMILFFGISGCLVAIIGIVGATVSQIADRRQELAVRLALGGRRLDLAVYLLRDKAVLAVVGTIAGVAGAYAAGRVYQAWDRDLVPMSGTGHVLIGLSALALVLFAAAVPMLRVRTDDLAHLLRRE